MGDVAASFRAFVFLDRKQAREGLSPSELARWQALKRELTRELSGGCDDEQDDRRGSLRVLRFIEVEGALRKELDALYERALAAAGHGRR